MPHELAITPSGHLALLAVHEPAAELSKSIVSAFAESTSRGLLHLATNELQTSLPATFDYVRSFARTYLTRLCQTPAGAWSGDQTAPANELPPTAPPSSGELATWILQTPPMTGVEYLREEALIGWWTDLDALVREEIQHHAGGAQA